MKTWRWLPWKQLLYYLVSNKSQSSLRLHLMEFSHIQITKSLSCHVYAIFCALYCCFVTFRWQHLFFVIRSYESFVCLFFLNWKRTKNSATDSHRKPLMHGAKHVGGISQRSMISRSSRGFRTLGRLAQSWMSYTSQSHLLFRSWHGAQGKANLLHVSCWC